jgi:hypothetical protein
MSSQAPSVIRGTNHPRWFAPVAAVIVLAGLVAGAIGFDATRSATPDSALGWGGLGAFAVAVVAATVLASWTRRELVVDGEGVELRGRGSAAVRIRWQEPHDFLYRGFKGTGVPEVQHVTVRAPDGRSIEVERVSVPGNPNARVAKVVEQFSTAANWPKIQARLQAGEEVGFGAVQMSNEVIRIGSKSHSLAKRVTLQIEVGKLKVGTEGKWTTTEVGLEQVANYPCLLKGIGQVAQALPPG